MITQFAIITALLIANYLSFWVLPNLLSADAATVVIQMIAIFNASVNPCIYLAFNQALSRRMIALAACRGIEAARNATVAPTSNVDTKTRATTRDSQL
uniref:G-protein coupled receptors family 1 profile domain-containing protein n=1 Tax=Romanomermis culicivorax TaxID=13658 RepID=A0A915KKK7_ROMCU